MDSLLWLSRLQFAATTLYHFLFVPLTMGLSILVATFSVMAYKGEDEEYESLSRFWGKLFLINFAVGVVTGIVQEFQFGMNWAEYSRFVGDVFGAPLAIEALLAFFLESTFLGIWIFGRERVPGWLHVASICMVAIGSSLSALWILVANSFMQHPVGYIFRNGRAEMQDFFALLSNPYLWHQFPHVFFSALATGAFFVMGVSAWRLAAGAPEFKSFLSSFKVAAVFALVASLGVMLSGHRQAAFLSKAQPMKLAAMEALYEDADPAPLSLLAWVDEEKMESTFSLNLPSFLSLLVYNEPRGLVRGMNGLQAEYEGLYGEGDYTPPVLPLFYAFRAMVGAGFAMIALSLWAVIQVLVRGRELPRWLWALYAGALLLPFLANTAGWILAELGRQPWVVYGVMKTVYGVSTGLEPMQVLFSLTAFTLLYGLLAVLTVYLMRHEALAGMPDEEED